MTLVRQKAWLVALVALPFAVLFAAWSTSFAPSRVVVRVLLPPLPPSVQPGPDRPLDPATLPRNGNLAVETFRALHIRLKARMLVEHVDSSFDPDSQIMEIFVSEIGGLPTKPIADRLALGVATRWNLRITATLRYANRLAGRRAALAKAFDAAGAELARRPSAARLAAYAQTSAEISRIDDRLMEVGTLGSGQAFVYEAATDARSWSTARLLAAAVIGLLVGGGLAVLVLLRIARRRAYASDSS